MATSESTRQGTTPTSLIGSFSDALTSTFETLKDSGYRSVAACLGLAALWLCLQASGFYPLSALGNLAECTAQTVANYHVIYTIALIVFAICAMVGAKQVRPLLFKPAFGLISGVAGVAGHVLLACSQVGDTLSLTALAGVLLVAFFIVSSILFWMERLAGNDNYATLVLIAVSYLVSQLASVLYFVVASSQTLLLIGCCIVCAICAGIVGEGNPIGEETEQTQTHSIRSLPWSLLVPALFLVYFCEVFIRLRIGDFGGDASVARKLLTSVIAGGTFTLVAAALLASRGKDAQRSLIASFAVLTVLYLIALVIVLVFDAHAQSVTNRILIACSHCVEVFLWMVVLNAVNEHRISPISAYGFMIIVAVAIPWAISFDAYYLLGLDGVFGVRDILVPGVAAALVVATVGTIVVLLRYAFNLAAAATNAGPAEAQSSEASAPQRRSVKSVLEPFGLTNREFEVAEYLYRGYSAKRIAEILFLSEASIRAYTMHIYRKMDIHSKQEFITYIDEGR